jgi:hypothetical protein
VAAISDRGPPEADIGILQSSAVSIFGVGKGFPTSHSNLQEIVGRALHFVQGIVGSAGLPTYGTPGNCQERKAPDLRDSGESPGVHDFPCLKAWGTRVSRELFQSPGGKAIDIHSTGDVKIPRCDQLVIPYGEGVDVGIHS